MHIKCKLFSVEREKNANTIKGLKQKLINTIKFMTINSDPDLKPPSSHLEAFLVKNQELENKIKIVESENFTLRNLLSVNREFNSYKSFQEELKLMQIEDEKEEAKLQSNEE